MGIDRKIWNVHIEVQKQSRKKREQDGLRQLALAIPPMEALTNDPNWDIFTKIAQARINSLQEELAGRREVLTDGPYNGTDEIIAQRIQISRLVGQIESLTNVQLIPRSLKEQGARAAELLREIGEETQ